LDYKCELGYKLGECNPDISFKDKIIKDKSHYLNKQDMLDRNYFIED
jgi:hypothetical protein